MRKILAVAAAAALALSLSACGRDTGTPATGGSASGAVAAVKGTIGVAMPTKTSERWIKDGDYIKQQLEAAGYKVNLQYANDDIPTQVTQVNDMVTKNNQVLVIASIDGTALGPVLQTAKSKGINVIAYDRLINGTENVDYYATFDNYKVGQLQGEFIKEKIASMNKPVNLEPFAGSPDDNNAKFFFSGAWDVLNPLVKSGEIVVPSGKAPATNDAWTSIGIQGWGSDTAQSEMQNRLNSFYAGGKKVNVVLSPNDSLALGIAQALEGAGYKPGPDYPILTGQDADKANVLNIIAGKQAMTVWKDTRTLGDQVAKMVDQIVKGQKVEVNDEKTYDNGKKVVPTYLLPPVVVTKDDIKAKLVDSGFYTASDLGL